MKPEINYDDFAKLDIRVAVVLAAEYIEGADKLLKITLDVGDEASGGLGQRTVAAGIKAWYQPEDLVGKQVIYLANLAARQLRGVESQGMILAAEDDQGVSLLQPGKKLSAGSLIR